MNAAITMGARAETQPSEPRTRCRSRRCPAGVLSAGTWLAVLLLLAGSAVAAPPKDGREMQAREAFAAGKYQQALDVYVKLYAEKLHPNYLRNIGRCYQNLGDPEKAISSFREYLRKARNLAPGEREEIDGYIREMQQLQQTRDAATHPTEDPARPPPPSVVPAPAPVPSPPPAGSPVRLQAAAPPPPVPEAAPPVYRRWWFWSVIGAAVLGGTAAVLIARRGHDLVPCEAGRQCQ